MLTKDASIQTIIEENRGKVATPYYLIDEARLLGNLEKIARVRERSGAKSVLALKCFSTWAVFDLMKKYMDGTTSSSLFEAKLGHEKFGKETHAYSVAFSEADVEELRGFASKVIFNSLSQLERFYPRVQHLPVGLRVNPRISHSGFDLADPARRHSRLGAFDLAPVIKVKDKISGVMFHCQCENDDFAKFCAILDHIEKHFAELIRGLRWVSLGGGIYFTKDGYPLDAFADRLKAFSEKHGVQVYLEPGEASITRTGYLVAQVLDIVKNETDIAIVDSAVEPHMLDLLIYRTDAKMDLPPGGKHQYTVAGKTCLAGDVFGTYDFPEPLKVGSLVAFADASGYTMVKKNWFNGLAMPAIAVRRLDGRTEVVREFTYRDYRDGLS